MIYISTGQILNLSLLSSLLQYIYIYIYIIQEQERVMMSVDSSQQAMQQLLQKRAEDLGLSAVANKSASDDNKNKDKGNGGQGHTLIGNLRGSTGSTSAGARWETRGFDYRPGQNPLFHSSREEDRILALVGAQSERRERSNSLVNSSNSHGVKRERANSLVNSSNSSGGGGGSGGDATGTHDHLVADVNRELKAIRESRDMGSGCACKPIKVDKLSVGRVREELCRLMPALQPAQAEVMPKQQAQAALKEVLRSCDLCVEQSCACVAAQIPCSAETCGCLKRGSGHGQNCVNEFGNWSFDADQVNKYRSSVLQRLGDQRAANRQALCLECQ
jgi:hypothetical protein